MRKIIIRYCFLAPDQSEILPQIGANMIVATALAATNNPTSATPAPKERASKVDRIPDEPNAIFKGIIVTYHGNPRILVPAAVGRALLIEFVSPKSINSRTLYSSFSFWVLEAFFLTLFFLRVSQF